MGCLLNVGENRDKKQPIAIVRVPALDCRTQQKVVKDNIHFEGINSASPPVTCPSGGAGNKCTQSPLCTTQKGPKINDFSMC